MLVLYATNFKNNMLGLSAVFNKCMLLYALSMLAMYVSMMYHVSSRLYDSYTLVKHWYSWQKEVKYGSHNIAQLTTAAAGSIGCCYNFST